jgi:uncharacterized protein
VIIADVNLLLYAEVDAHPLHGRAHLQTAFGLLRRTGTAANLTTDVQIAAHAIEINGEVHSNDVDFGRFQGVRWVNPLRS